MTRKELANKLNEMLGPDVTVSVKKVHKNNADLETMHIQKGNIAACIYEEADEITMDKIEQIVEDLNEKYDKVNEHVKIVETWEQAKKLLTVMLVQTQSNEQFLKTRVNKPFGDTGLSIVPYICIDDGKVDVTISLAELWHVDKEEIIDIACLNAYSKHKIKVASILDVLKETADIPDEIANEAVPMITSTNNEKYYGAATMLYPNFVPLVRQKLGCDTFFIIPSSVHEVICVPEESTSANDLYEMHLQVQRFEVEPTDRLINDIYYVGEDGVIKSAIRKNKKED